MFDRARTWKWAVPAVFVVLFFFLSQGIYAPGDAAREMLSNIVFGIALVCALVSLVNLGKYIGESLADQMLTRHQAQATTADVLLMQAARSVHPDTIALLFGERRRAWMLRAGYELPEGTEPYSVLYAAPEVTDLFLWHFLRASTTYRCMAKRNLSDNSYRFDPLRKVTDYDQYDILTSLLRSRGIITEHFSNGAPLWIKPWCPQVLAESFGLDWDEDQDQNDLPELTGDE